MTDLSDRLSPVVAGALRIVSGARAQGTEVVATELGECLKALGVRSPDRAVVGLHLASATVQATALVAAGVLPVEVEPALAKARNLLLEGSFTAVRLADVPFVAEPEGGLLVAAREIPTLRELTRSPPALDVEPDAPAPAAQADRGAGPEGDDETDDAVPDVEVEPPRLEWLEAPKGPYVPPQPLPPIRLGEGGERRPLSAFYRDVVHSALDVCAMLARHNADRPQRERRESEARILALTDAAIASGAECANDCWSWWEASLESPDPWKSWAPTFVLGSLTGADTLVAVQRRLESLGEKPAGAGQVIAESLAVCPHPDVPRLVRELLASSHPIARAAGIELASLRSQLSADDLIVHLCDANKIVLSAALRAAPRAPESHALARYVLPMMHYPERTVAWEAARALALWGRPEPYRDVVRRGKLAGILGPLTLELLVLYGHERDLGLFEAYLKAVEITPSHLSAVARFGHPLSWAFLLHFLADDDFVDAAIQALLTLFGPIVPRENKRQKNASAWRDAIARARLDPALRYFRGSPWAPQLVVEDLRAARLSRHEVERLVDELNVRLRATYRVDMALWSRQYEAQLASMAANVAEAHRGWVPGSWECAARA